MLVEFSVIPIGKGVHLHEYIAKALKIVDASGLDYRLTPMGTVVEGDWEQVFKVIKSCHDAITKESERVITSITIDDKKAVTKGAITQKVKSVEETLGKILKKCP